MRPNYFYIFFILYFYFFSISAQTILIDEDFSGGTLPTGWSNVNNGGTTGQIWAFDDPGNRKITAGNISGNYAILDSDEYGSGNNQNAQLLTPTFSTGIYETITLEFDYQYRDYDGGESCVVEVFNGTTWTEVFRKELGEENYVNRRNGADLESIDITTESGGASNAQVRFTYIGSYDWWWAIDNVKISGTSTETLNAGLGPGGVGDSDGNSSLKFWIRTDSGINTTGSLIDNISNSAGVNALDISESGSLRPTLVSQVINGYDEISFSGSNRLRTGLTLTTSNFITDQASSFLVARADNTTQSSSVYTTDPLEGSTRFSCHIPWSGTVYYDFGTCCDTSARIQVGSLTGLTSYSLWTYQANSSEGKQLYRNGTLLQDRAGISSYTSHATQRLNLGANTSGSGGFVGDVAEVIIFNTKLNTTQRIIVDNYLSAKFGLTLNTNDFYTQDDNGDFDHNVAGIGRASDGSLHLDSQGTGIIRINSPSDLNNDEFLFWGEDVKDANYNFSASSATNYLDRLDTKWRVSKRNDLGTVTVSINASDITLNSTNGCNDLKLIVSNSSNFSTKTTYDLVLSSGVYTATDVLFSDNDYFTIEYVDTIVIDASFAYNGSGSSNVPSLTDSCYRLLVKSTSTGNISLTENANVRELEVESSGKLVVDSGKRLQVTNGIQLDGEIRLIGSSQLLQTHSGGSQVTGSGSLYVDQDSDLTSVYRYNFWTSPVKDIGSSTFTVAGVMKDGTIPTSINSDPSDLLFTTGLDGNISPLTLSSYWIYGYLNGNDGSSWSQKLESGTFNPGEGYLLKSPGAAQNYTFKGVPNDGDISFVIDADKTSLLGNPYPSAIDANQLFIDSQNLATIYFWEHKNEETTGDSNEGHFRGGYIGGYSYRNATMGVAADTEVEGTGGLGGGTYTAPGRYIPIGQGFFAETASGLAATINFKNSQRYFETETGDSHFFKGRSETEDKKGINYAILKIGLEAKSEGTNYIHSQVGISFSKGKTFASEVGFDSKKAEIKETDIYFQFEPDGDQLVIAGVQEISDDLLVPITLKIAENADDIYLILDEKQHINQDVYIKDVILDQYYDISKPLKLNLAAGIYNDRFYITFNNQTLSTDDYVQSSFNLPVFFDQNTKEIVINNQENLKISKLELYTVLGQKSYLWKAKNISDRLSIQKLSISSGIYFLKAYTEKGAFTKKMFLSKD